MKKPHLPTGGEPATASLPSVASSNTEQNGNSPSPQGASPSVPKVDLSAGHRQTLEKDSAISPEIIAARGYWTAYGPAPIKAAEPRFTKNQLPSKSLTLVIPAYRLGDEKPQCHILRRDKPRKKYDKDIKYEFPSGQTPFFDVLPQFREALRDVNKPIYITEGAKKADALATAFGMDIVPISLNGVYGWRSKVTVEKDATATLSDLDEIPWQGRKVILAFDSDIRYNKNVYAAVTRFARVLAGRNAVVQMLVLPQKPGEPKVGVDDFLAQGHSTDELEAFLQDTARPHVTSLQKLGCHPATNAELYMPEGFEETGDYIVRIENGITKKVYYGILAVLSIGEDIDEGIQLLEVGFGPPRYKLSEVKKVVAPRAALGQRKDVVQILASKGAVIHDANATQITRYLSEFAAKNQDALPTYQFSKRLGNLPDGSLITPWCTIGGTTRYYGNIGKGAQGVGLDQDAYLEVLKEAAGWKEIWPFFLVLGFVLSSPLMQRFHVRRHPVLALTGPSNSGKTSVALFSVMTYAANSLAPFHLEAGRRTTAPGLLQSLASTGGLPVLIDEIHKEDLDVKVIETVVYHHANGMGHAVGTAEQKPINPAPLGGTLMLLGERPLQLVDAGGRNRVLALDAAQFPPLGCEATTQSSLGAERAGMLEAAWNAGAGHLGPMVMRRVFSDMDLFRGHTDTIRVECSELIDWSESTAIMLAVLDELFNLLQVDPPFTHREMTRHIRYLLDSERDPTLAAQQAWSVILGYLERCVATRTDDGRTNLYIAGKFVGWLDDNEGVTYLLTSCQPYIAAGLNQAMKLYGKHWCQDRLIEASSRDLT